MQKQVKMFHGVPPTFSMDIAGKWPYFQGKIIFVEPQGVPKIDFSIFVQLIRVICHYKMKTRKHLLLAIRQATCDFT